ncbi:MAG: Ig-like domain-containing protein [Pseudomonadota bacterium]|nr:Ig-like domain-containing protein [Pseudomonadota bacterium]
MSRDFRDSKIKSSDKDNGKNQNASKHREDDRHDGRSAKDDKRGRDDDHRHDSRHDDHAKNHDARGHDTHGQDRHGHDDHGGGRGHGDDRGHGKGHDTHGQGNGHGHGGPYGGPTNGGGGPDVLDLSDATQGQKINGGGGDDEITGSAYGDRINAGGGDDRVRGGAGDDTMFGNGGTDTAVFSGSILDYSIVFEKCGNTIDVTGPDGHDTLKHFEFLEFDDFTLDLGGNNAPLVFFTDATVQENGVQSLTLQVFDFDGDTPSVVSATLDDTDGQPGTGTLTIGTSTTITSAGGWTGAEVTLAFDPGTAFDYLALGETTIEEITLIVDDGAGGISTVTAALTIEGLNDAITIASSGPTGTIQEIADGAPGEGVAILSATGSLTFTDADLSDSHTVTATPSDPGHLGTLTLTLADSTGTGAGTVNWMFEVPDAALESLSEDETLVQDYAVVIDDGNGATATETVSITITGSNDAPTFQVGTAEAYEGGAPVKVDLTALADDVDSDDDPTTLGYAVTTPPGAGSVSLAGGVLTFDTGSDFNDLANGEVAVVEIEVSATDTHGASAMTTITVTVTGSNEAPVATADTATTDEDTAILISVLDNDFDPDVGDALSVIQAVVTTGGGTASLSGNDVLWDPGTDYDSLAVGETATVTVEYTIADGSGETDTGTVTITVTGASDGPIAAADTAVVGEGGPVAVIDVIANDSDPDGDPLMVASVDDTGTLGLAGIAGPGSVSYDPNGAFETLGLGASAVDTFTYTVTDGFGETASASVTVTVLGENDGPVASDDARTIGQSGSVSVQVLDNDSDIDIGDNLSIVGAVKLTSGGTESADATQIHFSTDGDFDHLGLGESVDVLIDYTVADQHGASDTARLTLTVVGENDGPDASGDAATLSEDDGATFIDLLGNDSDVDLSDVLGILSVETTGTLGAVSLAPGGTGVDYTPDTSFNALGAGESLIDTFTYTITDGNGATDTATVTVTILGENDAPTARADTFAGDQSGASGNVFADNGAGADSDPDASNVLQVIAVNGVAGQVGQDLIILSGQTVRLNADGTFTLSGNGFFDGLGAGESFSGTLLTYTVSDGQGGTDTASISVDITGQNDAPDAVDDGFVTPESGSYTADVFRLSISGQDSDPDGDAFVIVAMNGSTATTQVLASGAIISLVSAATGQINYDPAGAFEALQDGAFAADSFTYTISDGAGLTDTATVSVTVVGANDAPIAADDTNIGDPVVEAGVGVAGDDTATGNVLANDSDVDGPGPLAVIHVDAGTGEPGSVQPVDALFTQIILGRYGRLLMDADGNWTYDLDDLDPDTEALDAGEIATESFTYTVSDGSGATDLAVLTIQIDGSSDDTAPNAVNDAIVLAEDGSLSFDPRDNDSDDQGDPIAIIGVGSAAHGSVSIDDKGTATTLDDEVVYTPDADFAGSDSFTYTISDGQFTDTATVSVDVTAVADAPTVSLGTPAIVTDPTPIPTLGFGDVTADVGFGGYQSNPHVTALNDGGFMLTWGSSSTASNATATYVYTQEFDADGVAETPITLIPPLFVYPGYGPHQFSYDAEELANGTKVFGWSEVSSASTDGVHIRVELAGGGVVTQTLYTSATYGGTGVDITELEDGGFVVSFLAPTAPSGRALYAQRFDADGVAQTGLMTLYTNPYNITVPKLSAVGDGYVVGFSAYGTSSYVTYALTMDTGVGNDTPSAFTTVDSSPQNAGQIVDVAGLADDTFAVIWTAVGVSGNLEVMVARYDMLGTQISGATQVNTVTAGNQTAPSVLALDDGGFIVTWMSYVPGSPTSNGIYAQRFDASGAKVGGETRIDTVANGNEYAVAGEGIAQLEDGALVTAWTASFGTSSDVQFTMSELPPLANGIEDTALAIDLTAALTDTDGSETLSITLEGFPSGATFNLGAAGPGGTWVIADAESADLTTLTMTPPADWNGDFTLTATAISDEASNGDTATATATQSYTIAPVNDAPMTGLAVASTDEDTPVTLDVLDNASDVDGDPITFIGFTQGANGTVTLDDLGDADPTNDVLIYTPDDDFFGSDAFTYTITDGEGGTTTQTVAMTVGPVNDLPIAADISGAMYEGSQVTVGSAWPPITGPVITNLANYFVLEDGQGFFIGGPRTAGTTGDETEIHASFGFADGYIVLLNSGVSTGGESQFTAEAFIVTDGVMTALDAGYWSVDGYSGSTSISGSQFTGVGADQYFDLRFEVLDLPLSGDRTVSYQFDARRLDLGSTWIDSFVTRAVIEGERNVTLPAPPIVLTADVFDTEDDLVDLTFSIDDSATLGSVVNNGDGTFSYAPGAVFNGLGDGETALDSFTYTVTDSDGATSTATATVEITGFDPGFSDPFYEPQLAPTLADDLFTLPNSSGPSSYDVLANDDDPNGDTLSITAVTQPSAGSVSVVGNALVFDPGASFEGLELGQTAQVSVDYTVTDGTFTETATAVFEVTGAVPFDPGLQTGTDNDIGLVGQELTLQVSAAERTNDGTSDVSIDVSIGEPVDGLIDVVFVVDRSGSTEFSGTSLLTGVPDQNGDGFANHVIDAEILAVSNLVDAIAAGGYADGTVTLTLIPFNSLPSSPFTVTLDASDDVLGGPSDIDAFKAVLATLNGSGGTNYIPALEAANTVFDTLDAANGAIDSSKFVYFLTDGDPADQDVGEPDRFASIRAVKDQMTADGITIAAVGINANQSALRQEALDAVDNTGGGVFTSTYTDLNAALLAGAQPDAELLGADVFVFNPVGTQVGAYAFTDGDFSTSPFGLTLDISSLGGFAATFGAVSQLVVQTQFDTDDDGLSDLLLETVMDITGALPDAVIV